MPLQFTASRAATDTLLHIARRASALAEKHGQNIPPIEFLMDVDACHSNGCPLRLSELSSAEDVDFAHDVFGIRRHLDRKTGALGDCFLPRYAA